MKRIMIVIFMSALVVLSSGCATAKGLIKDAKNTGDAIMKADEWFRENCW
ncbi:MAG: hypothetical protein K9L71_03810 [Candidatus Omnitrophica bacterium]|nr:hypothetical protein [Candidatus Omnitrophota bacterium]